MTEKVESKKIGGWLILVGIGVALSPLVQLITTIGTFAPIFTEGVWESLTTVGSDQFHPMWRPLLIGEMVFNAVMLFATLYLAYLFFSKHYLFPRFYIGIVLSSLVFIVFDAWLVSRIFPSEPMFDQQTTEQVVRSAGAAVIWVPYMLVSKRVKATFVENMPNKPTMITSSNGEF